MTYKCDYHSIDIIILPNYTYFLRFYFFNILKVCEWMMTLGESAMNKSS